MTKKISNGREKERESFRSNFFLSPFFSAQMFFQHVGTGILSVLGEAVLYTATSIVGAACATFVREAILFGMPHNIYTELFVLMLTCGVGGGAAALVAVQWRCCHLTEGPVVYVEGLGIGTRREKEGPKEVEREIESGRGASWENTRGEDRGDLESRGGAAWTTNTSPVQVGGEIVSTNNYNRRIYSEPRFMPPQQYGLARSSNIQSIRPFR